MGKHRRLTAFARRTWNFRPLIALGAILLMGFAAIVYAAANDLYQSGGGAVADAGDTDGVVQPGPTPTAGPTVIIVKPGDPATASSSAPPQQPAGTPTIPPTTTTTGPAPGAVTGAYQVSDSWPDGFIALVTLKNTRSSGQPWALSLAYPRGGVNGVANSWIAGGGDTATLSWSGQGLTVTSNNPLAARATITLGIQFRKVGSDFTPTTCQVNQRQCSF